MKKIYPMQLLALALLSLFSLTSCLKNESPEIPLDPALIIPPGVFVLNEGSNKGDDASLSFIDQQNNEVVEDLYGSLNPGEPLGTGGNALALYGSKLYIAMNGSNRLEVLDAGSGESLKRLSIPEPSHIISHGGHIWVSSYSNEVYLLDTASLDWVKQIPTGRTPEGLAAFGNRVFVANAGWKDVLEGEEYDQRLTVIDAVSLEVEAQIEVEKNLDQVYADQNGKIYAINAPIYGDYPEILTPSRLHVIDGNSLEIIQTLDFSGTTMAIHGNSAYLLSNNYPQGQGSTQLLKLDLTSYEVSVAADALEELESPYGIGVDPVSGKLWISDGLNYSEKGKVYQFSLNLQPEASYRVGVAPRQFAFKP